MKTNLLYKIWAGFFALCAGLSFISEPTGLIKAVLIGLSIGFFLPPALILKQQEKSGSRMHIQIIRNLAAASLILTILLIIVNFMSLMATRFTKEFKLGNYHFEAGDVAVINQDKIDEILANPWLGIPVFALIMFLVFYHIYFSFSISFQDFLSLFPLPVAESPPRGLCPSREGV